MLRNCTVESDIQDNYNVGHLFCGNTVYDLKKIRSLCGVTFKSERVMGVRYHPICQNCVRAEMNHVRKHLPFTSIGTLEIKEEE